MIVRAYLAIIRWPKVSFNPTSKALAQNRRADEVPLRPGRIEPRVLKRRRDRYPLMHGPRDELREALGKT